MVEEKFEGPLFLLGKEKAGAQKENSLEVVVHG